jgi:hypothetical protein
MKKDRKRTEKAAAIPAGRRPQREPGHDTMEQSLILWATDVLWGLLFAVVAVFLLVAGLYMTVGPALRQGRAERRVARSLHKAGLTCLNDLVLKGRHGGLCQIDHLVRLPTGLVVLETCMRSGRLIGRRGARVWRQDLGLEIYHFGNPLLRLNRAMAAVRAAVAEADAGDLTVTGQVLVPGRTQFPRGRPEGVAPLGPFLQELRAADADGSAPSASVERAWTALREAGLARQSGEPGSWSAMPRRALRRLMADQRTATGVVFLGTGGLMLLALAVGTGLMA